MHDVRRAWCQDFRCWARVRGPGEARQAGWGPRWGLAAYRELGEVGDPCDQEGRARYRSECAFAEGSGLADGSPAGPQLKREQQWLLS